MKQNSVHKPGIQQQVSNTPRQHYWKEWQRTNDKMTKEPQMNKQKCILSILLREQQQNL